MSGRDAPLAQYLDQLEQARQGATPGEWRTWRDNSGVPQVCTDDVWVVETQDNPADAACIVAEHNAFPGLLSVVREMWDEHDGRTCADRTGGSFDGYELCDTRQMIAAALIPQETP